MTSKSTVDQVPPVPSSSGPPPGRCGGPRRRPPSPRGCTPTGRRLRRRACRACRHGVQEGGERARVTVGDARDGASKRVDLGAGQAGPGMPHPARVEDEHLSVDALGYGSDSVVVRLQPKSAPTVNRGSGAGSPLGGSTRVTNSLTVPPPGRLRFSGTVTKPQERKSGMWGGTSGGQRTALKLGRNAFFSAPFFSPDPGAGRRGEDSGGEE